LGFSEVSVSPKLVIWHASFSWSKQILFIIFRPGVLDVPIVKNGKGSASELAAQWLVLNQDKILARLPGRFLELDDRVTCYSKMTCGFPQAYPSTWLECHDVIPLWR
jgi:hypothetical protein